MRWRKGRKSENVEDRRGQSTGRGGFPGGLFPRGSKRGVRRGGGGSGMMIIIMVVIAMFVFGIDPRVLLQGGSPSGSSTQPKIPFPTGGSNSTGSGIPRLPGGTGLPMDTGTASSTNDEMKAFISVVLADTEDTWNPIFRQVGQEYREPKLVLFSGFVKSACGFAQAAMGPFYCPADHKVYIDLSFYEDLKNRHGAPGDFAQAYVIAHEVGHHVQNLLGISEKVQSMRRRVGKEEGNQLSVRLELQADCLAGVWGNHADRVRGILEEGDIEEALNAASSIGDDRLQRQSRGYISPESFTHGSSEQRVRWFTRGLKSGDLSVCNTFDVADL